MILHALGNDYGPYLRGDEAAKEKIEEYLPYAIIIGAFMVAALIMAGTGGRRS